ncbi:hypothetical protein [Luteolibacter rhizosphaerae]|nr:hypothetical protein [Luteolibacter rhizosphaerae]
MKGRMPHPGLLDLLMPGVLFVALIGTWLIQGWRRLMEWFFG